MREHFDVIIVGSGIVGIGLFRDLTMHGQRCLIIDKGDFSSQTSQTSSKMLHGGIRYLENFDFLLVREALHEKNLWIKTTPHLAKEIPFCLPVYKESKYPLFMTSIGLKVYDFLSGFKNKPHQTLGKKKTLGLIPQLRSSGLRGSGVYHDAIVDDHKLGLECLYDGLKENNGSKALNYHEITGLKTEGNGKKHIIDVYDNLKKEQKSFSGHEIIFASGPFTDDLLKNRLNLPWENQLLLSKGSHIWLNPKVLPISHPIVLQTNDKRVIFMIPQERGLLVGTTETKVEEEVFNIKASNDDIEYLLKNIRDYFPHNPVTKDDIISSFAGVRPLVREGGTNAHKASRHHKIYHIQENIHVIIGGKYTTFRVMGMPLTKAIIGKKGISHDPAKTLRPLRQKSTVSYIEETLPSRDDLEKILRNELVRTFEDLIIRRLNIPHINHWSASKEAFISYFQGNSDLLEQYLDNFSKSDIDQFVS